MKVNVLGWFSEKNIGDSSFKIVMNEFLAGHEVTYSEFWKPGYDMTLCAGGGNPVPRLMKCVKQFGMPQNEPIYALGVDIPANGQQWEDLKSFNFRDIYCRSQAYARETGVKYCPDIVFALPPRPKAEKTMGLGVILTRELPERHLSTIAKSLGGLSPTFLSMCHALYDSDRLVNHRVAQMINHMSLGDLLDTWDWNPLDVLDLIGKFSTLVTMRFHGAIFATISGTPFLSLANPGKHSLFCEQEGITSSFMSLSELEGASLTDRLGRLPDQDVLLGIASRNRTTLHELFDDLKKRWSL